MFSSKLYAMTRETAAGRIVAALNREMAMAICSTLLLDENNNARHSAAFNEIKYPGVNQNDT